MKRLFCGVAFAALAVVILTGAFAMPSVQQQGQTVAFEGYVESVAKNSLLVDGKILVINAYSSVSTNGSGIYVGDYVMGFIYLNEDNTSYTIVSLARIAEKSLGTPTMEPTPTATPLWAGLFTAVPEQGSVAPAATATVDPQAVLWDIELFGTLTPTPTLVPSATPSNIAFEGIVDAVDNKSISVNGVRYSIDSTTGYEDSKPEAGDYVQGRAAPYVDKTVARFIEVIPEYERPDAVEATVYGKFVSQDKEKIVLNTPDEGPVFVYLYSGSRLTKTYYTKDTIIKVETINGYASSITDYSSAPVNQTIQAVSGVIDQVLVFDDDLFIVSENTAYSTEPGTAYSPSKDSMQVGSPFIGLCHTGNLKAVFIVESNRVKELNGTVTKIDKTDPSSIQFTVGGVDYVIVSSSVVTSSSIRRNSSVKGYADSLNNILYLSVQTPWYADLMDWNWEIVGPGIVLLLSVILFIAFHKSKAEGFLQEVRGNIITLTDARGENKKRYVCNDEIARFVSSLVTMKVEVTIHHGKVVHIRYDF